jgi:serine/threonine protein kinase
MDQKSIVPLNPSKFMESNNMFRPLFEYRNQCFNDVELRKHDANPHELTRRHATFGARSSWSTQLSTDRSGDLEILSLLGEGSFGAVYKARHLPSGAVVAVKIIPGVGTGGMDDDEKIKGEIDILSRCDSPYIVGYFECFIRPPTDKPGEMWILMELCKGGSMTDLVEASAGYHLPEDCIRAVCASVVLGLEYLHGVANVCHRDIKAGNVLLTEDGHVKLADFGVSAELSNTVNKRKTVVGSPYWISPEVIKESFYDGRADVWSLGITVIELAEGAPPHSNLHPLRAIFVIPTKPAPTLADPDNWSPEMLDFVRCCCQKEPEQRHDSALLSSHPFVKQEVIALRAMHLGETSTANADARAKYKRAAMASQRQPGLLPIRRVMEQLLPRLEAVKNKRGSEKNQQRSGIDSSEQPVDMTVPSRRSPLDMSQSPAALHEVTRTAWSGSGDAVPGSTTKLPSATTAAMDDVLAASRHLGFSNDTCATQLQRNVAMADGTYASSHVPAVSGAGNNLVLVALDAEAGIADDPKLKEDMEKLSAAFQVKIESLKSAYELAQQELFAQARLRNQVPLDVGRLMDVAALHSTRDRLARDALADAATDIPAVRGLVESVEESAFHLSETSPRNQRALSSAKS